MDYITPKDAALYIGVSDQTIYNWIAAGIFQGVIKQGIIKPRYHIPKVEVERVRVEGNYGELAGNKYGLVASA